MLIIGMIVWGMAIGWVGQLILGKARKAKDQDWLQALIAGTLGSLVGGSLTSILMGEGFQLKIGGIVGSIVGAVIVLLIWNAVAARRAK